MEKIEIRPRFHYDSPRPPAEILERLGQAVKQKDAPVNGLVIDQHVYLRMPAEQQHFWSPQLNLEVQEAEAGQGSTISGLFGPRETVWLMYIFFYSLLGFISMMVMIMGFSQLNLGLSARILWLLPVLALLFLLAIGTARTGQKLGHAEMDQLYDFFLHAVES